MVETQNKMGGGEEDSSSSSSSSSLQVSVSFGKYENDAAWEKWSTFSSPNNNKYLEEVGKCSTPGSVAQKKAFFEAHYKKIAAMKKLAEEEEANLLLIPDHQQQQQQNHAQLQQINQDDDDDEQPPPPPHIHDGSARLIEQEPVNNDEHDSSLPSESSPIIPVNTSTTSTDKLEEAALVNVESMKLVQQHFQVDLPQIISQNVTQKINPKKEEKNAIGLKKNNKKPELNKIPLKPSLTPKTPETPATRLSKPKPKPKETSTSSSLKKPSAPSSSKNKNQSLSETRRVTPMSLHLSMSMNSVNSDTRRSLFMEQMGDKDIVKRAFKTFQNRVNQLPIPSSDSGPKQLPTKRPGQNTSKENERTRKAAAEKMNPARGQLGPTWKSVSSGSLKGVGVADERRLKAGPTSVALKSQERSERRKEFFKNLEEKSNARVAERSQLISLKSKEVKDTEMKTVRQKAKPMPKAQGVLKSA